MYIIGQLDLPIQSEYSQPGEDWTDADFARLLRMVGEGKRILVEPLIDIFEKKTDPDMDEAVLLVAAYDHDCDQIDFADWSDEASYRTDAFVIFDESNGLNGKRVYTYVKHGGWVKVTE